MRDFIFMTPLLKSLVCFQCKQDCTFSNYIKLKQNNHKKIRYYFDNASNDFVYHTRAVRKVRGQVPIFLKKQRVFQKF
jgi:hypothetical protein